VGGSRPAARREATFAQRPTRPWIIWRPVASPEHSAGSGQRFAPSSEERQNDVARLSLSADPHVEGNAAPFSTIGEPEALRKETRLVQTGPVRDRHAPLALRPRVLLHHVGPRTSGDRHGHRGARIDNRRELVPGELSVSTRVGWIHGRQEARLRKIPRAESDVMWPNGGQSAGELRRFLCAGQELGVCKSADNSEGTAGICNPTEAIDEDENRGDSPAGRPPSVKSRSHITMMARPRSTRGLPPSCAFGDRGMAVAPWREATPPKRGRDAEVPRPYPAYGGSQSRTRTMSSRSKPTGSEEQQ
jgi:hypothetical protein